MQHASDVTMRTIEPHCQHGLAQQRDTHFRCSETREKAQSVTDAVSSGSLNTHLGKGVLWKNIVTDAGPSFDVLLFAIAATLMHCAVHRRSNLARLSLIPFMVITIVEVFSHDGYVAFDLAETCLAIMQLGLMMGAVWLLFTPAARGWYSRGAATT